MDKNNLDFRKLYENNPFQFQAADVGFFGKQTTDQWIGNFVTTLLFAYRDEESKQPVVKQFTLILPPSSTFKEKENQIFQNICGYIEQIRGDILEESEKQILEKRVQLVRAKSLSISSVTENISETASNNVFVVVTAKLYQTEENASNPAKLRSEEDKETKHLTSLITSCLTKVKKSDSYIYFDVGSMLPCQQENQDLLESIDDRCGITGFKRIDDDPIQLVTSYFPKWSALIRAGREGEVLESISALPESISLEEKIQLKIQLFHIAQKNEEALALIKEFVSESDIYTQEFKLKCSQIALLCDDRETSLALLSPAIDEVFSLDFLEKALIVADELGEVSLIKKVTFKFEELFPQSEPYLNYRTNKKISKSFQLGRKQNASQNPASNINVSDSLKLKLQEDLAQKEDYVLSLLLAELKGEEDQFSSDTYLSLFSFAQGSKKFAFVLENYSSFDSTNRYEKDVAINILLWAIESSLIGQKGLNESPDDFHKTISLRVRDVISYLSINLNASDIRERLYRTMSINVAGMSGIAILAKTTLDLAQTTKENNLNETTFSIKPVELDEEKFKATFKSIMDWMDANQPIVIGMTQLPKKMILMDPDDFLQSCLSLLQSFHSQEQENDDVEFLRSVVNVCILASPHCETENLDLIAIRVFGVRLVLLHQNQLARDYAEQCLQLAEDGLLRKRIAWFTFADIYQRIRNPIEALIAISSAFSCEVEISGEQIWYELYLFIRITRDIGLFDVASSTIPNARHVLEELELVDTYGHRLETLEYSLKLNGLTRDLANDAATMISLVNKSAQNLKKAMELNDEILPASTILGQFVNICSHNNIDIEPWIMELLSEVKGKFSGSYETQFKVLSHEDLNAEDVLGLQKHIETTRYTEDLGYDVKLLSKAASKLLNNSLEDKAITLATEILSETRMSQSDTSLELFKSVDTLFNKASELSIEHDCSIIFLALSETGNLIKSTVTRGNWLPLQVTEFNLLALNEWAQEFPYQYGFIRPDDTNVFFQSIESIGIEFDISFELPVLIIRDITLQPIPINLILSDGKFLGNEVPVASVPSLEWILSSQNKSLEMNDKSIAWIPTESNSTTKETLSHANFWLKDTFSQYKIAVHNSLPLPSELANRDMAIIVAHGGISGGGKFFNVIADDSGELNISYLSLAKGLTNTKLVVLFICSGGRSDNHPFSNSSVGLPSELLKQGCTTIIASPWPLDATVVNSWLPEFLSQWDSGAIAIKANYAANRAVETSRGFSPQVTLAMEVYGNPFLSKNGIKT